MLLKKRRVFLKKRRARFAKSDVLAVLGAVGLVAFLSFMGAAREVAGTIASKAPTVVRKAKRAFNNIDADPMKTYRTEQGFTMELNLLGEGEKARDAFLRGERKKD